MRIKVKFFAYIRVITESSETEIEVNEGSTLENIMEILVKKYPDLMRYKEEINMAVNHEYAPEKTVVKKGDEVALLPPVSGG